MAKKSTFIFTSLLSFFLLSHPLAATGNAVAATPKTQHASSGRSIALLIGINAYPTVPMLNGAVNDATALRDVLVERYGFKREDIVLLADAQARKTNIMTELRRLKERSSPGDQVFIFFSGHGTSSHDMNAKLQIGDNTGALLPFDFTMDPEDAKKTIDSLIIGRRDLRPILEELDKDRQVIMVADACYSGNAVRSLSYRRRGTPKFVPLPAFEDNYSPTITATADKSKDESYPYRNVIYISAANDREQAQDLKYHPIDGKPHGALTGAMLRGMQGDADLNNDGEVSYEELYQFSKLETMKEGHTPQLLCDSSFPQTCRIFNASPKLKKTTTNAFSGTKDLRLRLEGGATKLAPAFSSMARVIITSEGEYDMVVAMDGDDYLFALANGDLLCRVQGEGEARQRLSRYLKVRDVAALSNPGRTFNVWLTVGRDANKSVFYEGENVSFDIKSEEDGSILLLDIDPEGYLSVIWPAALTSDNTIRRGKTQDLGINAPVSAPLGVESLKLFVFKKPVPGLKKFAGRSPIDPAGSEFAELEKVLRENTRPGGDWSEATVEVVTVKK